MIDRIWGATVLAGAIVAACFPVVVLGQDGLERFARPSSGPPLMVSIGLSLTVVSMMILLLVFLASARQPPLPPELDHKAEPSTASAAPAHATRVDPPAAPPAPANLTVAEPAPPPGATKATEDSLESGDSATVKCPRCGKVVVDFKEMRVDALSCPGCGELLRPAP
jgi:hypothetical protein